MNQKEFSLQTRVNYVLSPKMSLQVYLQREDKAHPGEFAFRRAFGETYAAPANDVLLFKIVYWFQR